MVRQYELTTILAADMSDVKQKQVIGRIEKLVGTLGGKVTDTTSWGKKDLFYPVKKNVSGVYFFLNLEVPTEQLAVLNREVELDEQILRHLLVIASPLKQKRGEMVQEEAVEKETPKAVKKATKKEKEVKFKREKKS